MNRILKRGFILVCSLFFLTKCIGQVTIIVDKIPIETPENATIYIAGNFNGWNPKLTALTALDGGKYKVILPSTKKKIEFKFTRGSWNNDEVQATGAFQTNHIIKKNRTGTIHLSIEGWKDLIAAPKKVSTANDQVTILTDSFYIPQLQRYRRIWIYLPKSYKRSDEKYPVLYMHDGQNIFDASTSYSGEWQVDETLQELEQSNQLELIVVGIDNGSAHRMHEYNPWKHTKWGGGEGDEYIDFIVKNLKPYIDSIFRTLSDVSNTGLMGSSMGGLISMYGIMAYPNVFGKAGVFSPSFWASNGSAYSQAVENGDPETMKIYMLMGKKEGKMMVKGINKMTKKLRKKGFDKDHLQSITIKKGVHKEWFWASEFEKAVLWLYKK